MENAEEMPCDEATKLTEQRSLGFEETPLVSAVEPQAESSDP